ncbi:hypothetical protein [Streptomyces tendae]|uniref:hypothetical protein n=1 Tax=Streptomyces tendae TaxID=1932 RepID=UPI00367A0BB9
MSTAITYDRYADTGRATLVPLLVDPATDRPRNLDLEVTPHLLVTAPTGFGATSALRLVAAHTARHGIDVQIIDFKRVAFRSLESAGLRVHRDPEDIAQAVTDFVTGMDIRLEELDGRAPETRRLLVVDGLERLRKTVVGLGPDRSSALAALERVAFLGRAAGYHLAASASPGASRTLRPIHDCSAVLALGPTGNRVRAELLGAGPRVAVPAGPGGGEFADYDGPRPVRTVYLPDAEARQVVIG